jgi:hypothetical protein
LNLADLIYWTFKQSWVSVLTCVSSTGLYTTLEVKVENSSSSVLNTHKWRLAGIPHNILEHTDIHLPYISSMWITSVCQFLYQHNIQVTLSETLQIRYSCKHDKCIMDTKALQQYMPIQQHNINLVRLYIQALTLSDISTADGKMICEESLNGLRSLDQRIQTHWSRQDTPTNSWQRLWKRYLTSNFIRYGRLWRTKLGPTLRAQPHISYDRKSQQLFLCPTPAATSLLAPAFRNSFHISQNGINVYSPTFSKMQQMCKFGGGSDHVEE